MNKEYSYIDEIINEHNERMQNVKKYYPFFKIREISLDLFKEGIYSEFMARKLKTPAIQFSIPGIFPLVPGITAYKTINYIVEQNYSVAYSEGIHVIVAAGAIGFGIMLSTTTFRFISKLTKKSKKNDLSENI